jgi:plasmid stabilization system protein ParE
MVKPQYQVVWDREALNHFKDILRYLEKQSQQAPKIVKEAILNKIDIVQNNPFICEPDKLKEPPDTSFRAFIVFNYRITYFIDSKNNQIRVLRIRHTSREPLGY